MKLLKKALKKADKRRIPREQREPRQQESRLTHNDILIVVLFLDHELIRGGMVNDSGSRFMKTTDDMKNG